MFASHFGIIRQMIAQCVRKQFSFLNQFQNLKQISGIEREKFIKSKIHPFF